MSTVNFDRIADRTLHCSRGASLLAQARISRGDVLKVTHVAVVRDAGPHDASRAIAGIDRAKMEAATASRRYLEHVEECAECHARDERHPPTRPAAEPKASCPRCGKPNNDGTRTHTSPRGIQCRPLKVVALAELPPVKIPGQSRPKPRQITPGDRPRVVTGQCHDCGSPVTGERLYCAHHAMLRQLNRGTG